MCALALHLAGSGAPLPSSSTSLPEACPSRLRTPTPPQCCFISARSVQARVSHEVSCFWKIAFFATQEPPLAQSQPSSRPTRVAPSRLPIGLPDIHAPSPLPLHHPTNPHHRPSIALGPQDLLSHLRVMQPPLSVHAAPRCKMNHPEICSDMPTTHTHTHTHTQIFSPISIHTYASLAFGHAACRFACRFTQPTSTMTIGQHALRQLMPTGQHEHVDGREGLPS
ncbi:hypothetical protein IWX47DRAFT_578022 [Phyllosticta citricarpa]